MHTICATVQESVSEAPSCPRSSSAETSSRGFSPLRSTAHNADCSGHSESRSPTIERRKNATTWPSSLIVTPMASSASKGMCASPEASSQTMRPPSFTYTTTALSGVAEGTWVGAEVGTETAVGVAVWADTVAAGVAPRSSRVQADRNRPASSRSLQDRNEYCVRTGLNADMGFSVSVVVRPGGLSDTPDKENARLGNPDLHKRRGPEGRPVRGEQLPLPLAASLLGGRDQR